MISNLNLMMLAVILGGQHYSLCNAVKLRASSLADLKPEGNENEKDEKALDLFVFEHHPEGLFNHDEIEGHLDLAEVSSMMETDAKYLERFEFE